MALLEWLIVSAAAFGGLVALMYVAQCSLYFPERLRTPPAMAGLPEAQEVELDTEDGKRVIRLARTAARRKAGGAVFSRQRRRIIVLLAFMRSLQMVTDSSRSATADTAVRLEARPRLG